MKKLLGRVVLALLIAIATVYAVDGIAWKLRVARGGGLGTVHVRWIQVAELKGGKEEMYPDGDGPVSCSESVFPHGGMNPCWYVARNPVVLER